MNYAGITRREFVARSAAAGAALGVLHRLNAAEAEPLPGTEALTIEGDLAAKMVDGLHKFLDRELAASVEKRKQLWKPDFSSAEAYAKSVEPNRERLRKIIGAVDERIKPVRMEYLVPSEVRASATGPIAIAKGDGYTVYAVRWPVFEGVDGEGLLLRPEKDPVALVVALPDCDWSPEQLVGMAPGVPPESQFARRLAENGCQVIVPVLIDRQDTWSGNPKLGRMTNQPHREFIYRMAYQLGRHIIGYEVQKVLAAVDWFAQEKDHPPIGVLGYGEGGLIALHSAALDARIKSSIVSGYFNPREGVWSEPIYRNVWALLDGFGDAELASLLAPRKLIVECSKGPELAGPPSAREGRGGAAPGPLVSPDIQQAADEAHRAEKSYDLLKVKDQPEIVYVGPQPGAAGGLRAFLESRAGPQPRLKRAGAAPTDARPDFDPAVRLKRQFDQLVEFTQKLMRQADVRRQEFFWSKLKLKSLDDYQKSCEPLRKYFWEEVIGKLPPPTLPAKPRSALIYDTPKWKAYDVVLDLYPDVFAYGILTVPKDLKKDERRPVVVCQHGLEGRPRDVVNPKEKTRYYNSFGSALADRGFIVFAPQNPYIGQNHFRQLQRKANPLRLSLFSFIVRQHQRILDWLETLPFVDPKRLAFYGLSYGGKTAMRVPAILDNYCLSICSGDFNEWIWKNASVDFRGSYMFTGEYEMFEFDLGNTFNYAEMAGLIAPRPFMVERGHDDGVGIDEWVAYEYAKVRRHYAKLGIPERTAIEFFNGGHEINGQGTFAFLHKHLNWPEPKG